jgi:hypothetical protein
MLGIIKHYYQGVRKEIRLRNKERSRLYSDAVIRFSNENPPFGNLEDYRKSLYKHCFTYEEYMHRYKLWALSPSKRRELISCWEMNSIYRKMAHPSVKRLFANKAITLKLFEKYVHRKWLCVRESSYNDFMDLLSSKDCIIKPIDGECGKGVLKEWKNKNKETRLLYEECKKQNLIVEECVSAIEEIQDFHDASLNTIRIVTMQNGAKCHVVGAALRIGVNNSVTDNVAAGGISAPIDIITGLITIKGRDGNGVEYDAHPNSRKQIKGFVIPHWKKLLDTCIEASMIVPCAFFVGWDWAVLPSGEVELIEANALPDVGVVQFVPGYEIKRRIRDAGKSLFHFNVLSLVSVLRLPFSNWLLV